ncbi:ribonuclease H-like domain-containing protein [Tanacetum coccineum]
MVKVEFLEKNNVLFTDTECLVLSSDFKLLEESQVLLRVPRKDNIYSVDLKSVIPTKVDFLRCDNGTEFKNSVMNQFCEIKGIKREFSVARTPQQNGVAESRNITLIEAARTMDHLGKFKGKTDEVLFVVYSVVSKVMKVFNKRTKIVKETLNIRFLENAPNVAGNGLNWLFDVDSLTISMNYVPVVVGNQTNGIAGTRYSIVAEVNENGASDNGKEDEQDSRSEFERLLQQEKHTEHPNSINSINTVSTTEPSTTNDAPSSPVNAAKTSEEHLFE